MHPKCESYPNVTFLGTASAIPNIYRNISSIMVNLDSSKSMLLDCAESTTLQINRLFANETEFNEALCRIKAVFLSHGHLDHFNGIFGLVRRRRLAFDKLGTTYEKLFVLYPRILFKEMREVSDIFGSFGEFLESVVLIQNDSNSENQVGQLKAELGLSSFKCVLVDHIPYSYGCVMQLNDQNK